MLRPMHVGIDASNLRAGGGLTHLEEFLRAADALGNSFFRATVWAPSHTLERLPALPSLVCKRHRLLDGNFAMRSLWRAFKLDGELRRSKCDVLFVPGGSYVGRFRPMVTMSRNLLPFDAAARRLYGSSSMRAKLMLLRWTQSRTFRSADGVIFLTETAKAVVTQKTGALRGATRIIPHGIAAGFFKEPRVQHPIEEYSDDRPFRLLYVSPVTPYKHQRSLMAGVADLRNQGVPVALDLVGSASQKEAELLRLEAKRLDASGKFIKYIGAVAYESLAERYHAADAFVFASSCENLPNILLEAMAAGLPIACSNLSVMPEVLGQAGVYFDPRSSASVAEAIGTLFGDPGLRRRCAVLAWERAKSFSWDSAAKSTILFLAETHDRATHRRDPSEANQ
jgi:glycosyltransferase involved in cell wall biosynthesis